MGFVGVGLLGEQKYYYKKSSQKLQGNSWLLRKPLTGTLITEREFLGWGLSERYYVSSGVLVILVRKLQEEKKDAYEMRQLSQWSLKGKSHCETGRTRPRPLPPLTF